MGTFVNIYIGIAVLLTLMSFMGEWLAARSQGRPICGVHLSVNGTLAFCWGILFIIGSVFFAVASVAVAHDYMKGKPINASPRGFGQSGEDDSS